MSIRYDSVTVETAKESDFDQIWPIFQSVVSNGDTLTFDPNITKETAREKWFNKNQQTYIAKLGNEIVGTYILRPNFEMLGNHIVNSSFIVSPKHGSRGIGRKMCQHAIKTARKMGFTAMQWNIVVSTNRAAVTLWKSLGFRIIGVIPKAFRHQQLKKDVDAYIMFRYLNDDVNAHDKNFPFIYTEQKAKL